jgi:hypothetical protein
VGVRVGVEVGVIVGEAVGVGVGVSCGIKGLVKLQAVRMSNIHNSKLFFIRPPRFLH